MVRRDTFRIAVVALLVLGVIASIVCAASVLRYLALERGPSNGFMTIFVLDAAHDRAVASGIVAILLLAAGGTLALVSRRHGKDPG